MKFIVFAALFAVAFAATKDDLVKDADRLKGLAQTEITKLKGEGKTFLAHEIEVIEKELIKVEKQVEALHPSTEIGKIGVHALDTVLKGLEHKLEAELKKLSGAFYDNTKDTLIADASRLKGLAQTEITKLKSEGKHLLATELQVLETSLIALEKQVEALHPSTELGKVGLSALEHVLKGLETKLENELKKLSGSFYDNTKDTLIADASRLKGLAQTEITKLKGEGKHLLATELQVLETSLIALEKQVESLHPSTEVGKIGLSALEHVLKGLETKLENELKKLSGSFYDNTKDTLIADASRLKGLAQTEITKLKSEGKHLLATELQVLETSLISIEKQVEALHPSTELGKIGLTALEHVLKGLENKLDAELKKLSGSF